MGVAPGIEKLPMGFSIIQEKSSSVIVKRPDDLIVFLDKEPKEDGLIRMLNQLRLLGEKEDVIRFVGMVRGYQIARGYANEYAPDVHAKLESEIRNAVGSLLLQKTHLALE